MKKTFDRVADVAKLFGCNTRNIEYRWTIFERHLQAIPTGSDVLDFGCGSLRESFELSSRGFRVTSFDLDADTLNAYLADYQWIGPKPQIVSSGSLSQFSKKQFSLVTAFDVFEHLGRPDITLADLASTLASDGLIFCTVPNGRSLAEIVSRIVLKIGAAMGHIFTPGVPHLQFRSTRQWQHLFERSGFEVLDHEMAIGFFVNTWAAIVHFSSPYFFLVLVRSAFRLPCSRHPRDPLSPLGGATGNARSKRSRQAHTVLAQVLWLEPIRAPAGKPISPRRSVRCRLQSGFRMKPTLYLIGSLTERSIRVVASLS